MVRLDRILQELLYIRNRLDDIERTLSNWQPQPQQISESKLLSLPDNLRKTYVTVASEGECNATEASFLTGRTRAIESSYLNQLVRMGWLTKHRESRTLIFRPLDSSFGNNDVSQANASLQTRMKLAHRQTDYS